MENMTVREYSEKEGLELSVGEIIIIQNMMRLEAAENDVYTELNNDVEAYPVRMLDFFLNI